MQAIRTTLASLVFMLGAAGNARAQEGEWTNLGPIVSGDMHAFVDYQVESSVPAGDIWGGGPAHGPASYKFEANPLWVNVTRPGLSQNDHVFVQIISYERDCSRGECATTQSLVERDLYFAEPGRFTGQMESLILGYQLNDGYAVSRREPYQQELVVWINGILYKDPQGHNLRLHMTL